MSVTENLEMGAFQRTDTGELQGRHGPGLRAVPAPARAERAEGRDAVRRRAADVRDRPRADGPPELLLLDEPSMGLAPIFVEKIFEIVIEINQQGTTVLLVEQNALDGARRRRTAAT